MEKYVQRHEEMRHKGKFRAAEVTEQNRRVCSIGAEGGERS